MSEEVFYADIELTDENFYLRFWTRDDDSCEEKSYDWLIEDLLYHDRERKQFRTALKDALWIMHDAADQGDLWAKTWLRNYRGLLE